MQLNLHPEGYTDCQVSCSGCGNSFVIRSVRSTPLNSEMCYLCHPAFTGKRTAASASAVDRFKAKFGSGFDDMLGSNKSS